MTYNPMRSVSTKDIAQYLTNGGIVNGKDDFTFAEDNDALKYIGYNVADRTHKFLLGCYDADEDNYFVTTVHVWLGSNGLLVADYAGTPCFTDDDPEEVCKYIEKRCN